MSKARKPAKKAAPQKSGLIMKSSSAGSGHAKPSGMMSSGSVSSGKKGGAQNNAPRKAQ